MSPQTLRATWGHNVMWQSAPHSGLIAVGLFVVVSGATAGWNGTWLKPPCCKTSLGGHALPLRSAPCLGTLAIFGCIGKHVLISFRADPQQKICSHSCRHRVYVYFWGWLIAALGSPDNFAGNGVRRSWTFMWECSSSHTSTSLAPRAAPRAALRQGRCRTRALPSAL